MNVVMARVIVSALIVSILPLIPIKGQEITDLDYLFLANLKEIFNLSRLKGDEIWPGLHYEHIPILIYYPQEKYFLFNHPDPPENFKPIQLNKLSFENPPVVHFGRFDNLIGQFYISHPINGIPTLVVPYNESEEVKKIWFIFVIHEGFHTFQSSHFAPIPDFLEQFYPVDLLDNNALAGLENRILAEAMVAIQEGDLIKVKELAREYAAVKHFRWTMAPQFVREFEQAEERKEMTAYYAEKMFQYAGKSPDYQPIEFIKFGGYNPYLSQQEVLKLIHQGIVEHIKGGAINVRSMPRYRIYDNGAAVGLILDSLKIDWKLRATKGDENFSFHGLIVEKFKLTEEELTHLFQKAKNSFKYDDILEATKSKLADYKGEIEEVLSQMGKAPGRWFSVKFSRKKGLSRSRRDKGKRFYLDNGLTTLHQFIERLELTSKEFFISVRNAPLIYQESEDRKSVTVEFKKEEAPIWLINAEVGEKELAAGNYSFSIESTIKSTDWEIKALKGEVKITPHKVEILLH